MFDMFVAVVELEVSNGTVDFEEKSWSMLNGKFFTGLPPKMMERAGEGRNRLESHLFWPDDTKVESAVEMRLKRRSSMQRDSQEKPQVVPRDPEVDTKQRFSREFAKSSIQFNDDLYEDNGHRSPMNNARSVKREIAAKPTAVQLELPESVVDEAYTSAKRKQAYTSKIEFFDFADENPRDMCSRNNMRKPKMDMNDKRDVERNTKNSPKLQVKRDMRSLSEEKELNSNYRERGSPERSAARKEENTRRTPNRKPVDDAAEPYTNVGYYENFRNNAQPDGQNNVDEEGFRGKMVNVGRPQEFVRNPVYEDRTGSRGQYSRSPGGSNTRRDFSYDRSDERADCQRIDRRPKRMPTSKRHNRDPHDDYGGDRTWSDVDYIENRLSNMRVHQVPKPKQIVYREVRSDDEIPDRHYNNRDDMMSESNWRSRRAKANTGNSYERAQNFDDGCRYMATELETRNHSPENGWNNRRRDNGSKQISVSREAADTGRGDYGGERAEEQQLEPQSQPQPQPQEQAAGVTRKHLRSSLCFHDGAIVANSDVTQTPTSASSSSSLASSSHQQRRNARSSATQRVSVGLPD